MLKEEIVKLIPQSPPFKFIDEIVEVDVNRIKGNYTFPKDSWYYQGHFPDRPLTPGVILIECMAQIGLVALGIYLLGTEKLKDDVKIVFSESKVQFLLPVLPEEKVSVIGEKLYFRLKKLKCKVEMFNGKGERVAKGELSGIML